MASWCARSVALVNCLAALAVLTGCSDNGKGDSQRLTMEALAQKCDKNKEYPYMTLASDKKTADFYVYSSTEAQAFFECVLKETNAPSSVTYKVEHSRAIDGAQEAEWDGWKMLWSFNKRLDVHLEEV